MITSPNATFGREAQPCVSTTGCTHCGADLFGAGLGGENGARFCCEGCRVVYHLLSGNEGGRYYELMDLGKTRPPRAGLSKDYREYLQGFRNPEALRRIGAWDANSHSLTLECSDMQCAACGWLMERLLGKTDGVLDYDVDFIHGEMYLRYDPTRVALPDVLENIGGYGYTFKPKSLSESRPALNRSSWMRLAVAAACFMNAMAFSLGPYFGFSNGMSAEWRRILGNWSFASALPAVFYAAFPFYQGAWRALRSRAFTIDVTVTLGIAIAFSASLSSVLNEGSSNYSDTLAGLVFFLLLGRYAVRRFEGGLMLRSRWHESLSPGSVKVYRDGTVVWLALEEVREGNRVEIAVGSYLPFDGVAETGPGEIDTAFLSGEERPRPYGIGDFLFAGYRVLGSPLRLRVVNPHRKTRAASLRLALESMAGKKRRRNRRREHVALAFTLVVIASAIAAIYLHRGDGLSRAMETSASVFIVSCSCALALAVPVTRGVGLLRAHRLGFHFRDQETLERLAGVRSVIFDKTGTLTFTRRRVARWEWISQDLGGETRALILVGLERLTRMSFHPVSTAIHESLGEGSGEVSAFSEIPHFGIKGLWSDGDAALRLDLCRFGAWEQAQNGAEDFNGLGLRVPTSSELSVVAVPQACLFVNGELVAYVWLSEELKPGVQSLLRELERKEIPVLLLSGDHPDRVRDFARNCGFSEYQGGLSPEAKQEQARHFQQKHGAALAVGDGFNDSLLFGEASVALAVQGAAGPMAEEADVFMTSPNPESILSLLRIGIGSKASLRNCYVVSALYNTGAISLAMAGFVSPLFAAILMPLASLSLCATAWVTIPRFHRQMAVR